MSLYRDNRHVYDGMPPRAAARVRRQGAAEIASPKIYLIFDEVDSVQSDFKPWHLYNLLKWLVTGFFAEGLRQYGSGPGSYAGYSNHSFPTGTFAPEHPGTELERIAAENGWTLDQQAIYFLFPGPQYNVSVPGFTYGVDYCAYHSVTDAQVPYALIPNPKAQGCTLFGQLSPLSAYGMLASHELAETMTDAIPGQGETEGDGEIDDFSPCLWVPVRVDLGDYSYDIQAYWSDADNSCWKNSRPAVSPTPLAPPSPASQRE